MYDIIVVGGGPAGLTAAIYGLRAGKNVLVVEKNGFGGQIAFSPKVENIPGFQVISGAEFADKLTEQAMALGAEVELEKVVGLEKKDGVFSTRRLCKIVRLLVGDAIAQGQEAVGEVDLLKLHTGNGRTQLHVGDVPEAAHTHFYQRVGQLLCYILGNAEDSNIGSALFGKNFCHFFAVVNVSAVDLRIHERRIYVKSAVHGKTAGAEVKVVQQCVAQITDTDQNDMVIAVHAEDLADLALKVFYIITVALLTKFTEATEILTDLGCGKAHFAAEQIGRNTDGLFLLQIVQITIISGKSADNGIRNVLFLHTISSFRKQDG